MVRGGAFLWRGALGQNAPLIANAPAKANCGAGFSGALGHFVKCPTAPRKPSCGAGLTGAFIPPYGDTRKCPTTHGGFNSANGETSFWNDCYRCMCAVCVVWNGSGSRHRHIERPSIFPTPAKSCFWLHAHAAGYPVLADSAQPPPAPTWTASSHEKGGSVAKVSAISRRNPLQSVARLTRYKLRPTIHPT